MRELNSKQLEEVNGGLVITTVVLIGSFAAAAFAAYQAGKELGSDYIQGVENS